MQIITGGKESEKEIPKEIVFVTKGPKNLAQIQSKIVSKYNNMINVNDYK